MGIMHNKRLKTTALSHQPNQFHILFTFVKRLRLETLQLQCSDYFQLFWIGTLLIISEFINLVSKKTKRLTY